MRFNHQCGDGDRWAGRRSRGFSFGPGGFHIDFGDASGPGPGSGWGGGHRRRDRKRMFEGGELRLVLLKLIADEPRPVSVIRRGGNDEGDMRRAGWFPT